LHVIAPLFGRRHCARVRPETDEGALVAEALTAKLANVQLTTPVAHVREAMILKEMNI
jgi:hypothetical protein